MSPEFPREEVSILLGMAHESEADLSVPTEVESADLTASGAVGRYQRSTKIIYISKKHYIDKELKCCDLVELYDTLVHESIHRTIHIKWYDIRWQAFNAWNFWYENLGDPERHNDAEDMIWDLSSERAAARKQDIYKRFPAKCADPCEDE